MLDFFKHLKSKYQHVWILSYGIIYMIWFTYLEKTITTRYNIVHCSLDDYIPFLEIFVIPYGIWFLYVAGFIALFFFISKDEYYRCCSYLFIGMTICLFIYTIYPNGQDLRPTILPRDNIFCDIIKVLYTTDTPTNVFPSIHCFNSIGITLAVFNSTKLREYKSYKFLKVFTVITTVLIMLSTVFIKQHSVLDMFGAILLSIVLYPLIYKIDYKHCFSRLKNETNNVEQQ